MEMSETKQKAVESQGQEEVVLHTFQKFTGKDQQQATNADQTNNKIENTRTYSTGDATLSDGINFTSQDEPFPQSAPVEAPNLRKVSEELIAEAYRQRKMDNLKGIDHFQQAHLKGYVLYMDSVKHLEQELVVKVQSTKQFLSELALYFTETIDGLKGYCKELTKTNSLNNSQKAAGVCMGSSFQNAVSATLEFKNDHQQNLKEYTRWLDKTLLHVLNQSKKEYGQSINRQQRQIAKRTDNVHESYKGSLKRFNKIINSLSRSKPQIEDLLQAELKFFAAARQTQNKMRQLGQSILVFWNSVQAAEGTLIGKIKQLMNQYIEWHSRIFSKSPQSQTLTKIWSCLQYCSSSLFDQTWNFKISQNILDQIQEVFGIDPRSFAQLRNFIKLEGYSVKIPNSLIQFLTTKQYSVLIDANHNGQCLKPITLYFTIDQYIVMCEQSITLLNKMKLEQLIMKVNQDGTLELRQKRGGFMASWNRQVIKFDRKDQLEEFMVRATTQQQRADYFDNSD